MDPPPTLIVHGKGQKSRYVPLTIHAIRPLREYVAQRGIIDERYYNDWLFKNHMGDQFRRQGINYIVKEYSEMARMQEPEKIPIDFSPHKMRHTTAMGLVDSGIDLIYVRDLLGHVSVKTTEVYARADATKKREAIEAAGKEIVPVEPAQWELQNGLKEWLKGFNR